MDAAPAILSEILKDEGWFMSQYMRRLSPNGTEGAFRVGSLACIPSVLAKLGVRDGAERAFGAGPPACIPSTHLHEGAAQVHVSSKPKIAFLPFEGRSLVD
jgi:hypothetical protein